MVESAEDKRDRAAAILARLREQYPGAATELRHRSPFELLVATILSAQATDRSVNKITPELFRRHPDARALAAAAPEDVESLIRTIGLYRNKAKNLVAMARQIVERYGGAVPDDLERLIALPGVGRKTANVVLASAFHSPAMAVDTHVARLAGRMGLSSHRQPDKVERDLQQLFDPADWIFVHHALILHGRRVCRARVPQCGECVVEPYCPSSRLGSPASS